MVHQTGYWLFLALAALGARLLPAPLQLGFVALVSLSYLATLDAFAAVAVAAWTLVAWLVAGRATPDGGGRTSASALIVALIAFLVAFKVAVPADWQQEVLHTPGPVPLGISYFVFKLLHFAFELRKGHLRAPSLDAVLAWMFLFPIFTAGPIERLDHFQANREVALTRDAVVHGLTRIVHGIVKRFVLIDLLVRPWLGTTADLVAGPSGGALASWGAVAALFVVAYLDFSAYSDLAIGSSRLMGFRIAENFDWPILAPTIGEFWRRWHMTLSGWCQSYVYLPMLGWTRNPYVATYASFLVMGLWHAPSPNWVAWGLWHATGLAVFNRWRRFARDRSLAVDHPLATAAATALTFAFVVAGSTFAATHGLGFGAGLTLLGRMIGLAR